MIFIAVSRTYRGLFVGNVAKEIYNTLSENREFATRLGLGRKFAILGQDCNGLIISDL